MMTAEDETLSSLLQQEGACGVARLCISPAFIGRMRCTLLYLPTTVRISIVDGRWGEIPFGGTITRPLERFHHFGPLASWQLLRAAAFASPSCCAPDILDGVSYWHAALDWDGGIEASWINPQAWPGQRAPCELVDAYQSLLESGLMLEPGTPVRIRAGALSGCLGRVERLARHKNRVCVLAEMVGSRVAVQLAASDLELASE